eukprot:9501776-Alexandrium_andersonii.AAC.1
MCLASPCRSWKATRRDWANSARQAACNTLWPLVLAWPLSTQKKMSLPGLATLGGGHARTSH